MSTSRQKKPIKMSAVRARRNLKKLLRTPSPWVEEITTKQAAEALLDHGRLPDDAAERKAIPLCTGLLDYFPDALQDVEQNWMRDASDTIIWHLARRGLIDTADGVRYSTKVARLALANLQQEIEEAEGLPSAEGPGLFDCIPDALAAIARLSKTGNDQHNPGQPLHWARGKSSDEADTILRHLVDRGKIDKDGVRHSTKVAWRALANLQKEIETDEGLPISRGSWAADRES